MPPPARKLIGRRPLQTGDTIAIDVSDFTTVQGDPNTSGLLRNFVRRGSPKWGSAVFTDSTAAAVIPANGSGKVDVLKQADTFNVNEPGRHTVVLVYFDLAADKKSGVFRSVVTEEVSVSP